MAGGGRIYLIILYIGRGTHPGQSARRNGDCSPQRTRKYIQNFL